jgi:hypothetical protein
MSICLTTTTESKNVRCWPYWKKPKTFTLQIPWMKFIRTYRCPPFMFLLYTSVLVSHWTDKQTQAFSKIILHLGSHRRKFKRSNLRLYQGLESTSSGTTTCRPADLPVQWSDPRVVSWLFNVSKQWACNIFHFPL